MALFRTGHYWVWRMKVMFSKPFPDFSCRLNALATALTCQWLMGPCKVNDVEIDGGVVGKGHGVLVERCRYLEQAGCASVCINSCKIPTQTFFAKDMGLPLTMTPNYDDFSCQPTAAVVKAEPGAAAAVKKGASAGGPGGLPQRSAATAGVAGSGGPQAAGRRQAAAAKQAKAGDEEEGEEAATDQWVQCSKCQTWRQVPDEFWPDIANFDEDEDWMCRDALWDVEDYEPNTPACC
ncbi:hypothetical protein VOLCADRAFT_106966 [Volvox carteri f. nagariensis]|uniref:CW-type domain-containing protein n=1 Tax=Volvox carteri f. nagariensis TaxID=3068 RepID=D8UAZ8_VOLCA|nr:uncharacterized protein VOLCADRAFT_106966 [Volvox carteri f. nagariensis]EFJ43024.1 hypothetical protein VOLCADRAFT_106966 [Volvox carteri f. nagariensis]|eukprot:XP_002955823.1 hypothetical protein VOLCADRAFT_106966 [Volvox carteri f. nagariensis]